MKTSQVVFSESLPKLSSKATVVVYDRKLLQNKAFKRWLTQFSKKLAVTAGEKLKDLDEFPAYVKKVLKLTENENIKELTVVAVGGGSVGDFAGFLASVLKRGVRLVHIPSTWLAAIDSAHGGKTALNVGQYKNQIGSFYPAEKVFISKAILATQTQKQLRSAYGELFKIALINGGQLMKTVSGLKKLDTNSLWKLLPSAIKAKIKIVNSDPYEKNKIRYCLNLGHTLGHAFELDQKLAHGDAVLLGTQFALNWSRHKNIITESSYKKTQDGVLLKPKIKKLNQKVLKKALGQDKKSADNSKIHFVFLKKPGQCVLQKVKVSEIVNEAKRQGWV